MDAATIGQSFSMHLLAKKKVRIFTSVTTFPHNEHAEANEYTAFLEGAILTTLNNALKCDLLGQHNLGALGASSACRHSQVGNRSDALLNRSNQQLP